MGRKSVGVHCSPGCQTQQMQWSHKPTLQRANSRCTECCYDDDIQVGHGGYTTSGVQRHGSIILRFCVKRRDYGNVTLVNQELMNHHGVVSVEMTMVMPRRSSCNSCWSLFLLRGGRYPCVLHNFIWGNLQQASIGFHSLKAEKMYLHHTPENASLASSPEKM